MTEPGRTNVPPEPASPTAPAETPASALQRARSYRLLLGLAAAVFVLDQLTKLWIASTLPYGTYGEATGAAWSMFSGQSVLLAVLAGATLAAIFFWRHALGLKATSAQVCFGLLCGGIVGNLTDRLAHGHVIDFVDLHFGSYIYPSFNVADSGICVGVLLYLFLTLRER